MESPRLKRPSPPGLQVVHLLLRAVNPNGPPPRVAWHSLAPWDAPDVFRSVDAMGYPNLLVTNINKT
jgi:hypothetical protein